MSRTAVLLAMGRDAADGRIELRGRRRRLHVRWDTVRNDPLYAAESAATAEIVRALGGRPVVSPTWRLFRQPVTVHNLGGCRIGTDPERGVVDIDGQVFGHPGLYVVDGAALPGATGGNPSLTIAAVAERCLQVAVRAITGNDSWQPPERADVVHGAVPEDVAVARVRAQGPMPPARRGIVFRETMRGAVAGTDVVLRLGVRIPDMNRFLADPVHAATLTGTVGLEGEAGGPSVVRDGILHLLAPSGLGTHATAGAHGARGPDRARSMEYLVPFTDGAGRECVLRGHKDVRRRSGTGPWRATTRLTATLEVDGEQVGPAGTLTITPLAALRLLASARATGLPRGGRLATAARAGATVLRFGGFFAKGVTSLHPRANMTCPPPWTVANRSRTCYSPPMTRTIAQRELRNDNARVIEAVTAGETFVVTRNGEPVAELRPLRAGRRTFISREEVNALATAGMRIDRHQFRADLDHVIDQGL